MARLNALTMRRLTKPGRYGDGDRTGLYLKVGANGGRSWQFRYSRGDKTIWLGLGAERDVTLAEARDKARDCRRMIAAGTDPLAEKRGKRAEARAAAAAMTFRGVMDLYIGAHAAGWRNAKHAAQWRATLDAYAIPSMGDLPVALIGTGEVMKALDPIWREKPETASRVRGRIEAVLDYASARGWRTGDNPARWRGHLANLLPARAKLAAVEHHAALAWQDMGAFMEALAAQAGMGALALRLAILTAARSGEVRGATWGEIDMARAIWTVPAARMKAGREHRVPLSDAALAVLAEVAALREGDAPDALVFPSARRDRPLSDMTLTAVLRRMGRGDLTAHGFRSTFRDWCAEATNYPREVAEAALAHVNRDKVEAAYARGDLLAKRVQLMTAWATFCANPAPAGEVVPLRRAVA